MLSPGDSGHYSASFSFCGSEPARDSGLAVNIGVECDDLIASRLTPTMDYGRPQILGSPHNNCGSGFARESGFTVNIGVECDGLFASKPAPTMGYVCGRETECQTVRVTMGVGKAIGVSTGLPAKNATRFLPTNSTVPWVASGDSPATCGVRTTLVKALRASGTLGSWSYTSSAAPPILRCSSAL